MKNTIFIFFLFSSVNLTAQDWKNWNALNLDLNLSKKLTAGFGHLRSYNLTRAYKNEFNQTGADLSYELSKKFTLKAGFSVTQLPADKVTSQKYFARGSYKMHLGEIFSWANGMQAELHTAAGKGRSYRFIYISRFALQHRLEFLNLSPSISYWLYYNMGGNAVQYFDESGSPLVKESPDGLHRGRFIVNLNSKINRNLSLSLYYINQHEFNLAGNDINVINPNTGKVARPFKNYQVAGASLSLSFDLFRKPGKKNTTK